MLPMQQLCRQTKAIGLCWTVAALLLLTPFEATAADVISSPLRAGAAAANITPQTWPQSPVGSFSPRDAMRAWDQLHARALVLSNKQTTIGFVLVDSCYCPRSLWDEAKRRIEKITGIKTDHLMMSATQTCQGVCPLDNVISCS